MQFNAYLDQLRRAAMGEEIMPVLNYPNGVRHPEGTPMRTNIPMNAPMTPMAMGGPDEENVDPEMIVTGQGAPEAVELVPQSLGNAAMLEEALLAKENAPPRKGMFGVKGTLRDVLGLVGDAFLVQSGNPMLYKAQRDKEKLGDAMSGISQDPNGAIERMAYEFPEQAGETWKTNQQTTYARDKMAQDAKFKEADDRRAEVKDGRDGYFKYSGQFAAVAKQASPQNWPVTRAYLRRLQADGKLGPEFNVPENYDPNWSATFGNSGMTPNQQAMDVDRDTSLGIQRDRATSARISATRPRAAPRPRARTTGDIEVEVFDKKKRGEPLNTEEQNVYDRRWGPKPKTGRQRPTATAPKRPAGW